MFPRLFLRSTKKTMPQCFKKTSIRDHGNIWIPREGVVCAHNRREIVYQVWRDRLLVMIVEEEKKSEFIIHRLWYPVNIVGMYYLAF